MTMAKPNSAQDQTVEEILASIRQVINGESSRAAPGVARSATGVMPPARGAAAGSAPVRSGTVTPINGGQLAAAGEAEPDEPSSSASVDTVPTDEPPGGRARMHDVIEMAIEQALDRVGPDETRAETAGSAAAEIRPPPRPAVRPRVEAPAVRETPRAVEPASRMLDPAPRPVGPSARSFEPAPRPAQPPVARSLLSPRANAAVAASFDDLSRALASQGSRDIDRTVEDLLRPMLKSWLEDNLPSLVERLVREEIERVSRGGR
jgi:uncharacterized protein